MNAERLNAICKSLESDFKRTDLLGSLQNTVNSLKNVVNQSNSSTQNELAKYLSILYAALEQSEYNHYSPSWRQIISQLRKDILLGIDLKENILSILSENTITLAVALEKIKNIHTSIKEFHEAIISISEGCTNLKIGSEELENGASDIGILIPRKYIENKLDGFILELKEINLILSIFTEYTTGKKHKLDIKTVSSTDLLIYLVLLPSVAACLAKSVSWIVDTYLKILQIRKIKLELINMGIPDKSISGITEYSNNVMREEIEKIVVDIEQKYCKINDPDRRNELHNGIRISLNKLANRIDKGFNIEIRMALAQHEEQPQDTKSAKESEILKKHYNEIQNASKNMEFRKLEGESLLSLPESEKKKEK